MPLSLKLHGEHYQSLDKPDLALEVLVFMIKLLIFLSVGLILLPIILIKALESFFRESDFDEGID